MHIDSESHAQGNCGFDNSEDLNKAHQMITQNMEDVYKIPNDENAKLRLKIHQIEMQNLAQQRRLKELEALVMGLHGAQCSNSVLSCQPQPALQNPYHGVTIGRSQLVRENHLDSSSLDEKKILNDLESEDMVSLMDEFDRNARENGIEYGITSTCSSTAHFNDLAEVHELESNVGPISSPEMYSTPSEKIPISPAPAFITPAYQSGSQSSTDHSDTNEPEILPQPCFTTPTLLTAEKLKEVETYEEEHISDLNSLLLGSKYKKEVQAVLPKLRSVSKVNPFTNLLAGIRQGRTTHVMYQNKAESSYWPVRGGVGKSSDKKLGGDQSPGSSVGSPSELVRKWTQSLMLPLLSPLPESHHASEDEELIVDEVVSQSVVGPSYTDGRHRSESITSNTGLCVPPDLIHDSSTAIEEFGLSLDEVEEENITTVITGDFDGSYFINEDMLPRELTSSVLAENLILEGVDDTSCDDDTQQVSPEVSKKEDIEVGGSKEGEEGSKGDVNLPAGSLVLAVVNEEGSLVPYIDVETVPEKTPVLEAGDVDSLLAQFEATEAVNKSDSNFSQQKNLKRSEKAKPVKEKIESEAPIQPTSSVPRYTPLVRPTPTPPTSQNIKDALPKDFIEKIKASNKRKSTQMLAEPLAVHKGRVVKKQETSTQRSKGSKPSSNQTKQQKPADLRIPPPLDHDYCCGQEKKKKGKPRAKSSAPSTTTTTTSKDGIYNKLPDYYTVLPKPGEKKSSPANDDGHDDVGKKDSGVESGDVSDASVETEEQRKEGQDSKMVLKEESSANSLDVYSKLPAYMTDIGNAIRKKEPEEEEKEGDVEKEKEEKESSEQPETKKVKRKLNLSEYRQRIKSAQSSRCPSPSSASTAENTNILQIAELVKKMEDSKCIEDDIKETEVATNVTIQTTEEDMEEGELIGDSEPEECHANADSAQQQSNNCVGNQVSKDTSTVENNALSSIIRPLSVHTMNAPQSQNKTNIPSAYSNIAPSYPNNSFQGSGPSGRWQFSPPRTKPRRWSSSSRSRSRTRSPRHSSSRRHRSSRGRRRRIRKSSRSSQSPRGSSWRCWSKSCSRSRSRSYSKSRSRSRSISRSRSRSRSRQRSRGSSLSSSCSSTASRSRSRSRSHSSRRRDRWGYSRRKSRHDRRSRSGSRSSRYHNSRFTRSRSPHWGPHSRPLTSLTRPSGHEDRTRQVEERRVIYVGRIDEGTTKAELRHRFERFGIIVDISVHFRERGDNYGFVTFKNREEAYNAVEHGNDDASLPRYDLCFGGRRAFCKVQYSDLDAQASENDCHGGGRMGGSGGGGSMDFDSLLRAAMSRNLR